MFCQIQQDFIFPVGETQILFPVEGLVGYPVDGKISDRQYQIGGSLRQLSASADQEVHPGFQLPETVGFDQIIVPAAGKPPDHIFLGTSGSEKQDRHRGKRADVTAHPVTVGFGQHNIQ